MLDTTKGYTRFSELVDVASLQALMDSFSEVIGIANAIIDVDGVVITSSGWQDVCVMYHRLNPVTCSRCVQSDTSLVESMLNGAPFAVYDCLNGLVDTAAPIVVHGQHVANVFTGQFFTSPPDLEFFRKQAQAFGFDEEGYLKAVAKVPVVPRRRVESLTQFYANFAQMLATNGLDRLRHRDAEGRLALLNRDLTQRVQERTAELLEKNLRLLRDEEVLRESQSSLKALFESMSSGAVVYRASADGRDFFISAVNRAAERIENMRREDMVGKNALDIFPGIAEFGLLDAFRRVWKGGMPEQFPVAFYQDKRISGWRENYVYKLPTGEVVAIYDDVTEKQQAEQVLRWSEERFRTMFEMSPLGMACNAMDGRFIEANSALLSMLGYSTGELNNLSYWDITPREYEEQEAQQIESLKQYSRYGPYEKEYINRDGQRFPVRLNGVLVTASDGKKFIWSIVENITEKKKSDELIWRQANFDTLTGLPNRRMLRDRLEQEIKKAHRADLPMALMFIDLDKFKEVNDTLGHDMGDLLLVEAARRIGECVRESDTVARMGGDEFTVILSELEDTNSVDRIAQDIIASLAAPFQLGDDKVFISASIGITLYPNDATAIESLLKNADQAMYAAKTQGRNHFSYFTPALQQAAEARMRLTNDLRVALENNQFKVYFQPIVDLRTGCIHKAEALIRWEHPVRGVVSPAEFIPLAEETGLIVEIGDWVFREAARQVKRLRELHYPHFQVSVNKSPIQFCSKNSSHKLWFGYLQELELPGDSMSIEITEGLLLDGETHVHDKLNAFQGGGIQVSLDDFGTGYSSLSYLKKFEIDHLKIDQSFVRNLGKDSDDMALCEAIIVMAHKLGLKVIAEGVETPEQEEILAAAGCDFIQGYLISRPVPPDEFERLLKERWH
jgi:diguanylate cyclase (GGDEF)-like protein/PAS domain S-box-containing protein